MSEQTRKMPSKGTIAWFWTGRFVRLGMARRTEIDLHLPTDKCWACSMGGVIQRCHITPRCELPPDSKKADHPANIHLLCNRCHLNSEFLTGQSYWSWLLEFRSPVAQMATVLFRNSPMLAEIAFQELFGGDAPADVMEALAQANRRVVKSTVTA